MSCPSNVHLPSFFVSLLSLVLFPALLFIFNFFYFLRFFYSLTFRISHPFNLYLTSFFVSSLLCLFPFAFSLSCPTFFPFFLSFRIYFFVTCFAFVVLFPRPFFGVLQLFLAILSSSFPTFEAVDLAMVYVAWALTTASSPWPACTSTAGAHMRWNNTSRSSYSRCLSCTFCPQRCTKTGQGRRRGDLWMWRNCGREGVTRSGLDWLIDWTREGTAIAIWPWLLRRLLLFNQSFLPLLL